MEAGGKKMAIILIILFDSTFCYYKKEKVNDQPWVGTLDKLSIWADK